MFESDGLWIQLVTIGGFTAALNMALNRVKVDAGYCSLFGGERIKDVSQIAVGRLRWGSLLGSNSENE